MIIYYSSTGNSEYAARALAAQLGDPDVLSVLNYVRSKRPVRAESERPYVAVMPVYISTIPDFLREALENAVLTGNRKLYFVMTCAGNTSAAGHAAKKIAEKLKMEYMGVVHLSMPQDYLMYFEVKSDEENMAKFNAAAGMIPQIADAIRRGEPLQEKEVSAFHALTVRSTEAIFQKILMDPRKFRVTDKCVSCGVCARVCPMCCIEIKNQKPSWSGQCVHCTACINNCPMGAIEYGKRTEQKRRYKAPRFSKQ